MKRILLVSIIALMATSLGLYGQEKDVAQPEFKIKLELICQLDSTKLDLGGKLISEIESALKNKAKGIPQEDIEWVLNKVRLDIVREKKILYTNDGKSVPIPYFCYLPHSPNYKYFILNTCEYVENGVAKNQQAEFVRTADGRVLWKAKNMMLYVFLSDDGAIIVDVTPPLGREVTNIRFYDHHGHLIKNIEGLCTLPMWASMSSNGNLFVIWDRANQLIAFNCQGEEVWRTSLPAADPKLKFFNSNNYLICTSLESCGATTLLIDDNGSVRGNFDFIIRKGSFTKDGKYLIFNVTRDSVHYLNIQDAQVIYEKIGNGLSNESEYYFVNLFGKLGAEGIVVLNKNGFIQTVYLKHGEVSPNERIITTQNRIYFLGGGR